MYGKRITSKRLHPCVFGFFFRLSITGQDPYKRKFYLGTFSIMSEITMRCSVAGYGSRSESGSSNIWPDNTNMQNSRNNEMMDTFDFLVKSLCLVFWFNLFTRLLSIRCPLFMGSGWPCHLFIRFYFVKKEKKIPLFPSSLSNLQNVVFSLLYWLKDNIPGLSSANNYVSMLTREQLSVLRSIRPSLLYEFLQEVAKARSDRRMRRALPNVS